MHFFKKFQTGSQPGYGVIKLIIVFTLIATFSALSLELLFDRVLKIPTPYAVLSLNRWGIDKFFIWQPLSYLFVEPLSISITFVSLLHTFFNFYVLWTFGGSVLDLKGKKHFLSLYLGGGLFCGLTLFSLGCLISPSSFELAGARAAIYALLVGWIFLFPSSRVSLFITAPLPGRWVVLGVIGADLFLDFFQGKFFDCLVPCSSLLFGYLYSLLAWELMSPFPSLHRFDRAFIKLKRKCMQLFTRNNRARGKIYDFKTGDAVTQEENFVDVCLDKISQKGKKSLSWYERWKLYRLRIKK